MGGGTRASCGRTRRSWNDGARRLALLAAAAVLPLAACDGDSGAGPATPRPAAGVELQASTTRLTYLGQTLRLEARVVDAAGSVLPEASLAWSSSAPAVADVDADGLVTARAPGPATISVEASHGGTSASTEISLTVEQEPASVSVTPPSATLVRGDTLRLVAEVADAGGSVVADPEIAWASSAPGAVAVDGTGLATATGSGSAVVTATSGPMSGDAALTARLEDRVVSTDETWAGEVSAGNLVVGADAAVIATDDLTLIATGDLLVEGAVTGDCVGITLRAEGDGVRLTGTLDNTCVAPRTGTEPAPPVVIESAGTIVLEGFTIRSSGGVRIRSLGGAATAAGRPGFAGASAPTIEEGSSCLIGPGEVELNAPGLTAEEIEEIENYELEPSEEDLVSQSFVTECAGPLTLTGASIAAADGRGSSPEYTYTNRAESGGDITLSGSAVVFSGLAGATELSTGAGSDAGDQESFSATGGITSTGLWGGNPGRLTIRTDDFRVLEPGALVIRYGASGHGADVRVITANGRDATDSEPARYAPQARAFAGDGGGIRFDGDRPFRLFGDVIAAPGGGEPSTIVGRTNVELVVPPSGRGGNAYALAGRGGAGSAAFRNGAFGGDVGAFGGHGGPALLIDNRGADAFPGAPGAGGNAVVAGGWGGPAWGLCVPSGPGTFYPGGSGGWGGVVTGRAGAAGLSASGEPGPDGTMEVSGVAGGGAGGPGEPGGPGGRGGEDRVQGPNRLNAGQSFLPGPEGGGCGAPGGVPPANGIYDLDFVVTVASDPGSLEPSIGMTGITHMVVIVFDDDMVVFSGLNPFPHASGAFDLATLDFALPGFDTFAGVAGAGFLLDGTMQTDGAGAVVGLDATLAVGTNGVLPGGNTVEYAITGSAP